MVALQLERRLAEDRRLHPVVVGAGGHRGVVVDEDAVLPDRDLVIDQLDAHRVPAVFPVVGELRRRIVGIERAIAMLTLFLAAASGAVNLDLPLVAQIEAAVAAVNLRVAAVLVEGEEIAVGGLGPDVMTAAAGSGVGEGMILDVPAQALLGPAVLFR